MSTLHTANATLLTNAVNSAHSGGRNRGALITRALLFALLIFTTVTVWVTENWAIQFFQIAIFALVITQVFNGVRSRGAEVAGGVRARFVYAIPIWGAMQLIAHTTTYSFATREEVLRWGALCGVFYLTPTATRPESWRQRFLKAFLCFATGMAILCLLQLNTSRGNILWIFETRYSDIYATFQNKNNYCQFVELALPVALWGAVREGWRSWWYALAGGVLYASAVGAASRAGFVLCTAELIAILFMGLIGKRKTGTDPARGSIAGMILIVPTVAAAFAFAVGWQPTWKRFQDKDQYAIRREFLLGAIEMAKHRPLTGYGLGTFEDVYQKYTNKDCPFTANHAHNDWAEFAAEGGIPFLVLVGIPFFGAIPSVFRHPWALGLAGTMLNAFVDYPFPRPAVSGWMFALLAMLYMTSRNENQKPARSTQRFNA